METVGIIKLAKFTEEPTISVVHILGFYQIFGFRLRSHQEIFILMGIMLSSHKFLPNGSFLLLQTVSMMG